MILFLASLPQDEYEILQEIFKKFEQCDLKEQTLTRTQRTKMSKLDCKGTYFKPLREVEEMTRKDLLKKIRDGDMSFGELTKACEYEKNMKKVQANFLNLLNADNWDEATKLYPEHTTKDSLAPFLKLSFKPSAPPSFITFCQQAKQSSLTQQSPIDTASESADCGMYYVKDAVASVVKFDVIHGETKSIIESMPRQFTGVHLTIVDPPKVILE